MPERFCEYWKRRPDSQTKGVSEDWSQQERSIGRTIYSETAARLGPELQNFDDAFAELSANLPKRWYPALTSYLGLVRGCISSKRTWSDKGKS